MRQVEGLVPVQSDQPHLPVLWVLRTEARVGLRKLLRSKWETAGRERGSMT